MATKGRLTLLLGQAGAMWSTALAAVKRLGWVGLVVGGVVGALVALPIGDWWEAQKGQPFVMVVLSNDDPNFTIPMELKQGILEAMAGRPVIEVPNGGEVGIEFVPTALTPDDTANAVRTRCLQNPDCIAVVGASDSTTTAAALRAILDYDGVRPALIMPIATATSLTETAARNGFSQILRLVPNNDDQAQQIKSFIASRAPQQRVTIIVDPDNPAYSGNLSEIIVQMIDDNGGETTTLQYVDSSTLANRRVTIVNQDFLVFVGTSSNGLEIIKDLRRLNIQVPIIFTDGNTVEEVINRSVQLPGPAYFLTPVEELNNLREPGYTAIGRDTYAILNSILTQSPRLTRRAVAEFVSTQKYNIELESGSSAGRYRFGEDGENSGMRFRIFSVQNDRVVPERRF